MLNSVTVPNRLYFSKVQTSIRYLGSRPPILRGCHRKGKIIGDGPHTFLYLSVGYANATSTMLYSTWVIINNNNNKV